MQGTPFKVGAPERVRWEGRAGEGWPLYDNRGVLVGWLASSELVDQIAECLDPREFTDDQWQSQLDEAHADIEDYMERNEELNKENERLRVMLRDMKAKAEALYQVVAREII